MGKYLKKFENHSAYEAAESSLILPNVSLCVNENEVHYKPYVAPDPYNGHEYVDLGLPSGTKWAKYNVGASSETDYGNYYQYGKGASQYSATSGDSDYSGTEDPLATTADTAAQVMGGEWHMPTKTQLEELTANTTYEWTTINGVNGGKFTAQNGNYVFLPAGGNWHVERKNVGTRGYYRSSTPYRSTQATYLFVAAGKSVSDDSRYYGDSVRGVVG